MTMFVKLSCWSTDLRLALIGMRLGKRTMVQLLSAAKGLLDHEQNDFGKPTS